MRLPASLIGIALAYGCPIAFAAEKAAPAKDQVAAATPATAAPSADRVANRKLLAKVRRAILHDKTLSMYAHNVRMAVEGGIVTITGEVRNAAERKKVEGIASKVAGVAKVDNQMTVTPPVAKASKPVKHAKRTR